MDTVLEKAIALETAKKQIQCMTAGGSVNAIRKREEKARDKSRKTCFNCGKKGYFTWDPCCPAKGRKCAKCSNMDILLLIAKEIILRWKVVKTANRKELAMANKELEVSCKERNPAFAFAVMKKALEEVCMVSILSESTMNVSKLSKH